MFFFSCENLLLIQLHFHFVIHDHKVYLQTLQNSIFYRFHCIPLNTDDDRRFLLRQCSSIIHQYICRHVGFTQTLVSQIYLVGQMFLENLTIGVNRSDLRRSWKFGKISFHFCQYNKEQTYRCTYIHIYHILHLVEVLFICFFLEQFLYMFVYVVAVVMKYRYCVS